MRRAAVALLALAGCNQILGISGEITYRDGGVPVDANPNVPDADPNVPDADPNVPDADPNVPDANPLVPDAPGPQTCAVDFESCSSPSTVCSQNFGDGNCSAPGGDCQHGAGAYAITAQTTVNSDLGLLSVDLYFVAGDSASSGTITFYDAGANPVGQVTTDADCTAGPGNLQSVGPFVSPAISYVIDVSGTVYIDDLTVHY